MSDDDRIERMRREHIATKTSDELREIECMECIVPLDYTIARLARDELDARGET